MNPPSAPLPYTEAETKHTPQAETQTATGVPLYPTVSDVPYPSSPQFPLGPTDEANATGNTSAAPQPPPVVNTLHVQWPVCGPMPMKLDCPFCHEHITTNTKRTAGGLPWILCGMCFLLGLIFIIPLFLCCIPFCVGSCMDVIHSCPSCKRDVGRFSRMR
uniref:LITAF domain-containing protein n=1 Tax=Steinernema glaseri TaxID=37863 RepID=A0A1I7YP62_9BILA